MKLPQIPIRLFLLTVLILPVLVLPAYLTAGPPQPSNDLLYRYVSQERVAASKDKILSGEYKFLLFNDDTDYAYLVFETPDKKTISMTGCPDPSLTLKKGDMVHVTFKLTTLHEAGEGNAPYYFWEMVTLKKL